MICPPDGLERIATATTPDESTPDQGGSPLHLVRAVSGITISRKTTATMPNLASGLPTNRPQLLFPVWWDFQSPLRALCTRITQ